MRIESAMTAGAGISTGRADCRQGIQPDRPSQYASGDQVQLPDELVNLKVAELHAGASAKVIQTASDMLGTLIDIRV